MQRILNIWSKLGEENITGLEVVIRSRELHVDMVRVLDLFVDSMEFEAQPPCESEENSDTINLNGF